MKLYSYFRSSASFRVRIALNLKGLAYDYVPVHLPSGAQKKAEFAAVSAEGLVPVLELDDGRRLTQSMAIIEYLDETHPLPAPLLPPEAVGRARVRALAQIVACEIHPLNNLRVLKYLVNELKTGDDAKNAWYRHWVRLGLQSYESHLAAHPGRVSHGDTPTLADCCLVPQLYNARRFQCPLDAYPTIQRIAAACETLPAFQQAAPEVQPDAD